VFGLDRLDRDTPHAHTHGSSDCSMERAASCSAARARRPVRPRRAGTTRGAAEDRRRSRRRPNRRPARRCGQVLAAWGRWSSRASLHACARGRGPRRRPSREEHRPRAKRIRDLVVAYFWRAV